MDIGHQLDRMKELPLGRGGRGARRKLSLLSIGADVNWRNGDGETPIAACRSGHRGVAGLRHRRHAMGTSRNGESALHAACRRGDEELCALLVDAGAHDEGAFEAGVSAGHGAMVSRLRGLGRRHAAAAQASSSRRPPPSIRSAALPAVEPPRRSPRRIRDPAQELLEEVRSGYRERAADAAERRMRDDEPPLAHPQAVDIVAARLDEPRRVKGGAAEKRKGAARGGRGESPVQPTPRGTHAGPDRRVQTQREGNFTEKRPAAVARARVIWYGGRGISFVGARLAGGFT